jgi:hypothetical protein
MSIKGVATAQYLGRGDPALAGYHPTWLNNMADDAPLEGSLLDGAVQGAAAVRSIVATIRSLYDRKEHKFAGPCGDNGFLEDYVAEVRGAPIGCIFLVTRGAARQTRHVGGELPPTQLAAALVPLAAREVCGHPICGAFCRYRGLKRTRSVRLDPLALRRATGRCRAAQSEGHRAIPTPALAGEGAGPAR